MWILPAVAETQEVSGEGGGVMNGRLGILWNNTSCEETCPVCRRRFVPPEGYQVFLFQEMEPAVTSRPVCNPCVQLQEPELVEMIELGQSYARFQGKTRASA